ncbi:MAG: hypothetical protein D6812_12430 [Deltaproteobacteria bacterium]|nr:MAG: hypothetical protein D6812_12430 [Deltaproteobacteria bacterium]
MLLYRNGGSPEGTTGIFVKALLRRCGLLGLFSLFPTGLGASLCLPDWPSPFDEDLSFVPAAPDPNAPRAILLEGARGLHYDIVRGALEVSILSFRRNSVEPASKMPALAEKTMH